MAIEWVDVEIKRVLQNFIVVVLHGMDNTLFYGLSSCYDGIVITVCIEE